MKTGTSTDEQSTIHIYGPLGIRQYLHVSLSLSRSDLGYKYEVHELIPNPEDLPEGWEVRLYNLFYADLKVGLHTYSQFDCIHLSCNFFMKI